MKEIELDNRLGRLKMKQSRRIYGDNEKAYLVDTMNGWTTNDLFMTFHHRKLIQRL